MKNKIHFTFLMLILIFSLNIELAYAQTCSNVELSFGGSTFSDTESLCPAPTCYSLGWETSEIDIENEVRFKRIDFNFDGGSGNLCNGGPLPFSSSLPMGEISISWNFTGKVQAEIFVEVCQMQNEDDNCVQWSIPQSFCTKDSDEVEVLGTFLGQGTSIIPIVIGTSMRDFTVSVDDVDLDFFGGIPDLSTAITWSLQNVTSGGSFTIASPTGNSNSTTVTLNIDDCSDGDLVATATDICGRTIEYKRFEIRRTCPQLIISGPTDCDAVYCGGDESFIYTVSLSEATTVSVDLSIRFPSNMILLGTDPWVTITTSGGKTILSATQEFTFEIRPPFVGNYFHSIFSTFTACPNTVNECSETIRRDIYSGNPNAIDLGLSVYNSSDQPNQAKKLCLFQNNYIEAFFNGEVDPCIEEWDWVVPAGWSIQFPDLPFTGDKSTALVIPSTYYGEIFIRARNRCGWSEWISYGFSAKYCSKKNPSPKAPLVGLDKTNDGINFGRNDSINGSKTKQLFSIYPNPVRQSSELKIIFKSELINNIEVKLFDSNGKTIFVKSIPKGTLSYPLSIKELPEGLYFVKINSGDKVEVKKVFVFN